MYSVNKIRMNEVPFSDMPCALRQAADTIEELLWCINYMATCDNCKYFGGCCCDHVDEDGNCLGWELARKPAKQVLEERKS